MPRHNKIQIPIEIRQCFKLETNSFLRKNLEVANNWITGEEFFARLSQDGRITVPWEVNGKYQINPGEIMRLLFRKENDPKHNKVIVFK